MSKIRIAAIIIFLGMFFTPNLTEASHMLGGEIVWECLPSGQYRFSITIYRDCTGATFNNTSITLSSDGPVGSINCPKISTGYVNKQCGEGPCSSYNFSSTFVGAVEVHKFRSGPVTLSGVPPAQGWNFYWDLCCRPGVDNIVGSPDFVLRAKMYPYTPAGATAPLNASTCYDNSPNFLEEPNITVCSGFDATYLPLGSDSDLDSIYYEWAQPKRTGGAVGTWSNLPFVNGFAYNAPLPTPAMNSNNTPTVLNGATGEVSFKVFNLTSTTDGEGYTTCIKVSEYRCGQLIGEVFRDIPIFVKPCTPPSGACGGTANNAPSLTFGYDPGYDTLTPVYGANGKIAYYEMTVYAKTEIKFKMTAQDYDLQPNCSSQQIKFSGKGGNLSPANATPPYGNTGNCSWQTPCATITSLNSNNSFTAFLNNDVEFNWQTTCDHLSFQPYQCGVSKNTYDFFFRFEDNACPLPATSYANIRITVLNYPPIPPDLSQSCVSYQPNGDITFDWIPPADTGIQFDYYEIYRSTNGGTYAPIATVSDYLQTTYTDANPPAGVNAYFMRTFGGCDLVSDPSDTIQSIVLNLTATPPPPNSSVAELTWNAKNPSGPNGEMYQVWRTVCGDNSWELIDSTATLAYNDTVNICGECLQYQIRINNGCHSTLDSAFLSDQNNNDVIPIDSVTVINGLANIAWDTSAASSDIVEYLILREDNMGSWVPIATVDTGAAMPYEYTASTATTASENYKVVSVDSCGNQSSDLNATAHRTLFLNINADPCDAFVRLRWNTYRTWTQTAVSQYELFADVTPPGGPTQTGVLIYQGGATDSVYDHTSVQSGYEYCYYVRVRDTTGLYTSTSNVDCITSLVVQKSKLQYMARVTVKPDKSLETYTFIDKDADVIDYGIERSDNETGPWLVLGRVPKPTQGPWEIKFTDYSAASSENRYYYRLTSQDSCGGVDTVSNLGRNILLQVRANGNLTNTLVWNPYEQWGGDVGRYEVYRQIDNNGAWTLVTDALTAADTTYIDNIRPFGQSSGAFCYYVKAVEANNPLGFVDEYGQPFSSVSNQACVSHNARVFVPTAFNPASEMSAENRVWKPSNVFARENSYQMFVMNRWGDKIFQTTNPDEGWDGTYKGEAQPAGVYTYYINYRSLEGLPIEERGTFTLFRNGAVE